MRRPRNPDHFDWHLCWPRVLPGRPHKWYVVIRNQTSLKGLRRLHRWLGKVIEHLESREG